MPSVFQTDELAKVFLVPYQIKWSVWKGNPVAVQAEAIRVSGSSNLQSEYRTRFKTEMDSLGLMTLQSDKEVSQFISANPKWKGSKLHGVVALERAVVLISPRLLICLLLSGKPSNQAAQDTRARLGVSQRLTIPIAIEFAIAELTDPKTVKIEKAPMLSPDDQEDEDGKLTILTDASVHPQTGGTGVAAYCCESSEAVLAYFPIPLRISEAEQHAVRLAYAHWGDAIAQIQTDSRAVRSIAKKQEEVNGSGIQPIHHTFLLHDIRQTDIDVICVPRDDVTIAHHLSNKARIQMLTGVWKVELKGSHAHNVVLSECLSREVKGVFAPPAGISSANDEVNVKAVLAGRRLALQGQIEELTEQIQELEKNREKARTLLSAIETALDMELQAF